MRETYDKRKYENACFIHLQKAFDTISHKKIEKLENFGFRGTINHLLESYLTDRKQYVEINKKNQRL